jgi:glycolate oxidase FAD binding subunit
MATITEKKSVRESVSPEHLSGVADAVRAAYEASQAVYPLGGGTAQNYGSPPKHGGATLSLASLARIVDYTPRDMTIVVEAGVRMADLAATLAAERQHLPIDVPRAGEATIGGVVATNWSGPRRLGYGTIRDYVIGIHAVDGRGTPFKGGGRVVKNVAGYDFCKLLTGSLGTLGVITQLALKVKPQPECAATVLCECADLTTVESALNRLAELECTPVAIDWLSGAAWNSVSPLPTPHSPLHARLAVRFEGTESEINWIAAHIKSALNAVGCENTRVLPAADADELWNRQVEFSDRGPGDADDNCPMVIKIAVPPSATVKAVASLLELDANCTIQAYAGSGVILARFSQFRNDDVTRLLVGKLRPAAVRLGGSLVVVRTNLEGLTPHVVWGGRTDATLLLEQIKRQFDPRNILNPGRLAYD